MFVLIVMSHVLVACGGGATETKAPQPTEAVPATEAPTENVATEAPTEASTEAPAASEEIPAEYQPSAVSGDIIAAVSSTVFPLAEGMKQRFEEDGLTGNLTIDSIGSGAGFVGF